MIQLLSALHLMVAALLGGLPAAPQATPVASPIGRGPGFELPTGTRADRARPIGALRCTRPAGRWAEAHVEVFAHARVVILPPGIGIARPRRQVGATVVRGRCSYPLHTADPTGVVGFRPGRRLTLGDLFAVWGQPLGRHRLLGFTSRLPVRVYIGGRARPGDPARAPLRAGAEVVLEIGRTVPPHRSFVFTGTPATVA